MDIQEARDVLKAMSYPTTGPLLANIGSNYPCSVLEAFKGMSRFGNSQTLRDRIKALEEIRVVKRVNKKQYKGSKQMTGNRVYYEVNKDRLYQVRRLITTIKAH